MSYKQTIEIEHIQQGNIRAARDSIYEANLRFDGEWPSFTDGRPWHPGKAWAAQMAKVLVHSWDKVEADDREWHETYLKTLEEIEPGLWHVVVVEPATD